jgi:LmbE family N-acetylglucosaminyl deacetylase
VDAVYPASRNAMAFPHLVIDEGLEPHTVKQLFLFFTEIPNAYVDVTDTIDTKIKALQQHVSQLRKPEELEGMLRGWSAEAGKEIGVGAAEVFRYMEVG